MIGQNRQTNAQPSYRMRPSTVLLLALITAFAVALAAIPAAAETPRRDTETLVRRAISLEQSKGRMIRFDVPVKTVFIANPDIADVQVKSPMVLYVTAKRPGETSLIVVDESDRVLANIGITVNHNLSRLKRTLDAVLPGNRIQIRSVDGAVVLAGEAHSPLEATQAAEIALRFVAKKEEIVNSIAVKGPNLVNLRVRIVEMQRAVTRQIGINWDAVVKTGLFTFGVATGATPVIAAASQLGVIGQQQGQIFNTRRQIQNNLVNGAYGRYSGGSLDLTAMVDLLEADGLVKTLAQPNLSAMSGKSAHFLAGGEFPIPIPQADGVVTVEFKKFGVSLSFTPVILSGNRISLRVAPEVSQLSNNGAIQIQNFQIPALITRRADTMVEAASGQSIVIAGLLMNNVVRDINKVPWLSDVPVLGKLFTSENFQRQETELVIIVTPYIVEAVREAPGAKLAPPDPALPGPGPSASAPPASPAAARNGAPSRLVGPGGFQLD
jgi:pilus assembly protein CpaC